jgi:hypothetical protein
MEKFKKTFRFDVGRKYAEVRIEVEIDAEGELHMVGDIDRSLGGGAGQCYDEILELVPGDPKVARMVEVWKRWHLNNMKPGCEHQRASWDMSRELTVYHFRLTSDSYQQRRKLEKAAVEAARQAKVADFTDHERALLAADYSVTSPSPEPPEFYELSETEVKVAGWVYPKDHPEGVLTKPCEVCGYRYGTAWLKEELPVEIVEEITSW